MERGLLDVEYGLGDRYGSVGAGSETDGRESVGSG